MKQHIMGQSHIPEHNEPGVAFTVTKARRPICGRDNPDLSAPDTTINFGCGCKEWIDETGATQISRCGHDDCERERLADLA